MISTHDGYLTHLFTIRLWPEFLGGGQGEWRGQVRHMTSGEVRYFREWSKLVAFLSEMLPELDGGGAAKGVGSGTSARWE